MPRSSQKFFIERKFKNKEGVNREIGIRRVRIREREREKEVELGEGKRENGGKKLETRGR